MATLQSFIEWDYKPMVKKALNFPIEKCVALSMAAMALGIAAGPDRGVAGFINSQLGNASSYDFASLLAFSALFLFCYSRNRTVVYIMVLPLWGYMLMSIPYVMAQAGAPPTLPIVCISYLFAVSQLFHYHNKSGYYDSQ